MDFDIYRRGAREFVAVRKQGGWVKSQVFARSFRLTRGNDEQGHPVFTLHVKSA